MTALTDAVVATAPVLYWPMGELSGSSWANLGSFGAFTIGTIDAGNTLGAASVPPGDLTTKSVFQDRDIRMGGIVDGSGIDLADSFTCMAWAKPTSIKANAPLFGKGANYGIGFVGSSIQAPIGDGQTPPGLSAALAIGPDLVVPGGVYGCFQTWDKAAGLLRLVVNGVQKGSRSYSPGAVTLATNAFNLDVGGATNNGFGAAGLSGYLGHVALWTRTLTDAEMRGITQVAFADVAEVNGVSANTFPWSRVVLAANVQRNAATFTNEGDTKIFVACGGTAFVNAGRPLAANGGSFTTTYGGAISAIHRGVSGAMPLAISLT